MEHADRGCGRPRSRRPCPGSRGSAPRRRRRRRRRDRAGWSLRMLLIGKRVDLSEVILSDALSRRQVWIAYISPPRPTCAAAARGGPQKHRIRASRHGSRAATAGLVRRDVASAVGCVNSAAPTKHPICRQDQFTHPTRSSEAATSDRSRQRLVSVRCRSRCVWGAQIRFRLGVQDCVNSVDFAHPLRAGCA
jgi:hypothetical protein